MVTSRLGWLLMLLRYVRSSIAEEDVSNQNEADPKKGKNQSLNSWISRHFEKVPDMAQNVCTVLNQSAKRTI